MKKENELINKTYHELLIEGDRSTHPINILGDLYMAEQQKEIPDLSYIRFAQGEVYFHARDFETAIFKWENLTNELAPWAKKNTADAYYELGILTTAEEIYQSIQTDSAVLKIEVLLKLFSLYVSLGKLDSAVDVIKEAISLNPDYEDVTEKAKVFFEEYQDWKNAVELAVAEGVRTKDLLWFDALQSYVEQGKVKKFEPNYFNEALAALFKRDMAKFESLTVSLWGSYKSSDLYFAWIKEINHILLQMEGGSAHEWKKLSAVYQDAYLELISGKYLIRDISHLIPNHLVNWMKIADSKLKLAASSSILAWCEVFPASIEESAIHHAEQQLKQPVFPFDGLDEGYKLFESIIAWTKKNGIEIGQRFEWMVKELLEVHTPYLLVAGAAGTRKSEFINALLGEKVLEDSIAASVMFKDQDETELTEITEEAIRQIPEMADIQSNKQTLVLYKRNAPLLRKNSFVLIETPGMVDLNKFRNDVFQYLQLADSMLFVLHPEKSFSEEELEMAKKISEQAPELPISFLIQSSGTNQEMMDQIKLKIHRHFPNTGLFSFSGEETELTELLGKVIHKRNLNETRMTKVHHYIRKTIKYLLERRVELENGYIDTIKWNEEISTKLNGAVNQMRDMDETKSRMIKKAFNQVKEDIKEQLIEEIPAVLKGCSDLITENSDFSSLDAKLNEEMNRRIQNHLQESVSPRIQNGIHHWMMEAEKEFDESQRFLDELGAGFNELYKRERLVLACDFRVLDDWRRDVDRMTRGGIEIDKINILLHFSPAQFLLKSAGKLLGGMRQNQTMLYKKYKQFIENEDYSGVAEVVAEQVFRPFELFERAIDRDISMFFSQPLEALVEAVKESEKEIEQNENALKEIRTNPENYRDPLTLFQIRLRQQEWMTNQKTDIQYV